MSRDIASLINSLTNDEDKRQQLWVYYLSSNDALSLPAHLKTLQEEEKLQKDLDTLWALIASKPAFKVLNILDSFTDLERSIIALLMLGLDLDTISKYKLISPVRLKQVIMCIKNNSNWNKLWLNEISQTSKNTV